MGTNVIKCLLVGLSLQAQVVMQLDSTDAVSRMQHYQNEELRYYERTHSARDEGFGCVMARWQALLQEMAQTDSLRSVLQTAVDNGDPGQPMRGTMLQLLHAGRSMVVESHRWRADDFAAWWLRHERHQDEADATIDLSPLIHRQAALLSPFHGTVRDSSGVYTGALDARLRPEGYGTRRGDDGSWTEGYWHEGRLHGWALSVPANGLVLSGRWRKGRFLGERMEHTPERVYGIDISRYQHEQRRRTYPIDWRRMSITSPLPSLPVTFVYIKATQGITIQSRFYAGDARAARRRGIAVGAYHFFSPAPGLPQAQHFLEHAQPQSGDMPPMLDIELTESQITAMGGEEAMFNEIEAWCRVVQEACGTRPVLYMGQNFVMRHLPQAPMTLQGLPMWVARYSEYRPFVRLAFWQLSQSGRVNGIHGPVDIDVFNGTRDMFEEFKEQYAVRCDN